MEYHYLNGDVLIFSELKQERNRVYFYRYEQVPKREKCTPYPVKAVNVGAELHVLVMAMGM